MYYFGFNLTHFALLVSVMLEQEPVWLYEIKLVMTLILKCLQALAAVAGTHQNNYRPGTSVPPLSAMMPHALLKFTSLKTGTD